MKENNNYINEELEDLAPKLSKLTKPKRSIDDTYFASMQDKVFERLNVQQKEEESLELYFKQLPSTVSRKIDAPSSKTVLPLYRWAAVIVLVLIAGFVFNNQIKTSSTTSSDFVSSLDEDEVLYLLSEYSSSEELAQLTKDIDDEIHLPEDADAEELLYMIDEIDLIEELEL